MPHKPTILFRVLLLLALVLSATVGIAGAAPPARQPAVCDAPTDALGSGAVTVQGWVINHREQVVDGTRTPAPLQVTATGSDGATVTTSVAGNGFFKLSLTPDNWNFTMQLPQSWDGIVPVAPRAGLAETGCTPLPGSSTPYLIVFKIRRLFDVTALKWEELATGAVQAGAGWKITYQPVNDPFAVLRTGQTDANGATTAALTPGKWYIYETVQPGWWPVTPSGVWITLDQYAPPGALDPVIFKNRLAH